jgi:hypothetical protein
LRPSKNILTSATEHSAESGVRKEKLNQPHITTKGRFILDLIVEIAKE